MFGDRFFFAKLSKSQSRAVSRPSVVAQHLSAAHLALAEVLRHSAADLREGGSHDLSEVSLWTLISTMATQGYETMRSDALPDTLY